MLRRKFTARENLLLLVLTILMLASVYYLLLLKPVLGEIRENRMESSLLNQELNIELAMAAKKRRMVEKLEHPPEKLAGELMPYDNAKNEIRELDRVLQDACSYDISADIPVAEDGIVRRSVQIHFLADSYEQVAEIIRAIEQGPYRCLVSELELTEKEIQNQVEARIWVTYFEVDLEEMAVFNGANDV